MRIVFDRAHAATALAAGLLALISTSAWAQAETKGIDALLDKLEDRLKKAEEASAIPEAEGPADVARVDATKKSEAAPDVKLQFRGSDVTPEQENGAKLLGDLKRSVAELDGKVEQLSADIEGTKQRILEDARIDNFMQVSVDQNGGPDGMSLRTLRVKIDDFQVYGINEATGFWSHRKLHPIFAGPLKEGRHKVSVEARVALRSNQRLALENGSMQTVTKDFDLFVPSGKSARSWILSFQKNDEGQVATDLIERNLLTP